MSRPLQQSVAADIGLGQSETSYDERGHRPDWLGMIAKMTGLLTLPCSRRVVNVD